MISSNMFINGRTIGRQNRTREPAENKIVNRRPRTSEPIEPKFSGPPGPFHFLSKRATRKGRNGLRKEINTITPHPKSQ